MGNEISDQNVVSVLDAFFSYLSQNVDPKDHTFHRSLVDNTAISKSLQPRMQKLFKTCCDAGLTRFEELIFCYEAYYPLKITVTRVSDRKIVACMDNIGDFGPSATIEYDLLLAAHYMYLRS